MREKDFPELLTHLTVGNWIMSDRWCAVPCRLVSYRQRMFINCYIKHIACFYDTFGRKRDEVFLKLTLSHENEWEKSFAAEVALSGAQRVPIEEEA